MASKLKTSVKRVIDAIPFGRDLFLHLTRKRYGFSFRGVYSSKKEALAAAKGHDEYDIVNEEKGRNLEVELASLQSPIEDYEYPLFYWLSRLLGKDSAVYELGGSVGHLFFKSLASGLHPPGLRWTIAELPAAVELGARIAEMKKAQNLNFVDSSNTGPVSAGLFITAGTIQYMDAGFEALLEPCSPDHVLINHLPVHDIRSYWTLQQLKYCEVPYFVRTETEVTTQLNELGFELINSWRWPRSIEVPFHSSAAVGSYNGYYFRRR